jgi:hypothetical protein
MGTYASIEVKFYLSSMPDPSALHDDTLPALRRVHVAGGSLHGIYIQTRNPRRQQSFIVAKVKE